jgi:hypothetical protein
MKLLPRIILAMLATSVTPGVVYNGMRALWCAFDPGSRRMVLSAMLDAKAFDLSLAFLPLGVVFVLAILWWERKFDALTISDYLFGGCACGVICGIPIFALILHWQISLFVRLEGDYITMLVIPIAGILAGLGVFYRFRPLDRRIVNK